MKFNTIIFISILTFFTSCNSQANTRTNNAEKQTSLWAVNENTKSLSNNIMVIYQDKKNNYWFGSWQDGLYQYDGKSIKHFTAKDGLTNNRIEEIKEDKLGNIFINTGKGLFQYNGNRFLKLSETPSADNEWKLNPDDLWFKSSEYSGSVYRYDGKNLFRLKLPKSELGENYIQKHPGYPKPYAVYCIYKDSKQNIWFGTSTLGACRYDGKSFDWISEQDVTEIHDGPANGVRSITEDRNGDFWFNTEYRYSVYNKTTSTTTHTGNASFYDRVKSIGSLDGNKDGDLNEYLSIIKDDHKNLWMAIYLNGVWKYDGEKIIHYPIRVNGKNIPVFCLFKDNKGDIWLGTHENGAFKFDGNSFIQFVP